MSERLGDPFQALVALLADPHRRVYAYNRLVSAPGKALPAVRRGLSNDNPAVRRQCCKVLDRVADSESFADLLGMLSDPHPGVRIEALHALACDRCKGNACRPRVDDVLPVALRLLREDPHKHVRAMACEVVGRWVHSEELAKVGVCAARDQDPEPSVRKKAGWYAPGGTIFLNTAPTRRARR